MIKIKKTQANNTCTQIKSKATIVETIVYAEAKWIKIAPKSCEFMGKRQHFHGIVCQEDSIKTP